MKKIFFGKGKIQNFGLELSKAIPNSVFDTQTGIFNVSLKSGNINIGFYECPNVEEAKKLFLKTIRECHLDTVDRFSIYNWVKSSNVELNYSINEDVWNLEPCAFDICIRSCMLELFQNIKESFECDKLNHHIGVENESILIETPYFRLPINVNLKELSSAKKMRMNFVIDFAKECTKMNNLFGTSYESNDKVRKALENLQSLDISYDEKYELLKCIEKIPTKTDDFIKIYKNFVASSKEDDFSTGVNILIGKYLYLSHQNAIMPDLKEFNHLPKDFFDTVEEIEKYSNGASIEER